MHQWRSVCITASGVQEHLRREWDCDPAWDVVALYEAPDGELVSPDGSKKRFVFWNRHIDRRFHIEYPRSTRAALRPVSGTVGDPGKEWDTVIEYRDRYLKDAGLSLDSPPEAIAKCLADTFKSTSYFRDKPLCPTYAQGSRELTHPVEGLLFKSFCVGCAHAYAALADACGFPVRTVGLGAHRIAEVRVADRWHFIENSCRHDNSDGLEAYFPAGFMETTLNPERYLACMPRRKANNYLGAPNGQFHFMGGTWQCPTTLRFAASNAFALYPRLDRWGFKSGDGKRLPIVLRANGFYWEEGTHASRKPDLMALKKRHCPFPIQGAGPVSDFLYHPFRPGEQLRQSVWLDACDGMTGLEIVIPVAPEPHLDFGPALGNQLVVQVNDVEKSLAELGAWPGPEPDTRGHRRCTFVIPATALRPQSVNWILLHNRSRETFQAPFLPAAMEPYIAPLGEG